MPACAPGCLVRASVSRMPAAHLRWRLVDRARNLGRSQCGAFDQKDQRPVFRRRHRSQRSSWRGGETGLLDSMVLTDLTHQAGGLESMKQFAGPPGQFPLGRQPRTLFLFGFRSQASLIPTTGSIWSKAASKLFCAFPPPWSENPPPPGRGRMTEKPEFEQDAWLPFSISRR